MFKGTLIPIGGNEDKGSDEEIVNSSKWHLVSSIKREWW